MIRNTRKSDRERFHSLKKRHEWLGTKISKEGFESVYCDNYWSWFEQYCKWYSMRLKEVQNGRKQKARGV